MPINSPVIWASILRQVKSPDGTASKSATVAGGAIRDYIMDGPVKDIDVFVQDTDFGHLDCGILMRILAPSGIQHQQVIFQENPEYDPEGNITFIQNYIPVNPDEIPPIQVIGVKGKVHDHILNEFDIGLCKTWFRKAELHQHREFWTDRANKEIYMEPQNNDAARERVRAHAQRIAQKYPDFRVLGG